WSFATLSLKSTSTSVTWPDTWLPTVTVEIALSVPVAEIATRMSPRSTVVVRQAPASSAPACDFQYHAASTASATTTPAASTRRVVRGELRLFRGVLMRTGRGKEVSTRINAPGRRALTAAGVAVATV